MVLETQQLGNAKVAAPEPRHAETVMVKVYRYNPRARGEGPKKPVFKVPVEKGTTVLEALLWIKEHDEPGLALRYSCRMGICGSCGVLVNGQPRLACETQVEELDSETVEVGPLPTFPLIRDLATDFSDFLLNHHRIKPYLLRNEDTIGRPVLQELSQTEQQKLDYYQFTMCIMCGLCNAACPVQATDREFLGPQALAQAYRFAADSRDQGWPERRDVVDTVHGCWGCRLAGSCSFVCPKGVDPALGIQLLKRRVLTKSTRSSSQNPKLHD